MSGWVAGAIVVGAVVGAAASDNAADSQLEGTQAGIAAQDRQAALARADQAPYRAAGVKALGQLETENDRQTTAADAMSDPGYQFGLQQGQQALDRKAAAAGGRVSGAALKSASEYATNYATTGYSAAYQRRQDRLNRLAALAGIGQTSTNASAASGANAANAISGLVSAQGNATGAAQLAQGNIWGNAANQLGAVGQRWASAPTSNYTANTAGVDSGAGAGMNYNVGADAATYW